MDTERSPDPDAAAVLVIAGAHAAERLARALSSAARPGFRVTVATDLASAAERASGETYDAILLDLGAGEQAADVVRQVRALAPDAALVVVDDGAGEDREGGGSGADDRLAPDEPPGAIVRCLHHAVERRRLRRELRRREEGLEASEARFRSIIQRTADGIVIVGDDGRIRFVNPAAERLFGRNAAELLGEEFGFAVLSGETTEIDVVRRGESGPVTSELRASDTTWEGAPAQVISLRDITDRKRAEERAQRLLVERAAREQAEKESRRSRFLADAGAVLDSSLDPDATLASLARLIVPRMADCCLIDLLESGRLRRVAGAHADPARQPLVDELARGFSQEEDSPALPARVVRTGVAELHAGLDDGGVRRLVGDDEQARGLIRLGIRSCMVVPLHAREHPLGAITFVCAERDFDAADLALGEEVASRAGRTLENARLYEAALAASRAKSDFLTVMSHELRTPLNAILGYTALLLDGVAGEVGQAQGGQLRRIELCARQLLQLIEEVLTYAETEAGRAEPRPRRFTLAELAEQVAATAEPLAREKGLEFRVEVAQPDAVLFTDAGRLGQIALSLLANAVKFTDRGSVRLSAELDGDELVMSVSDTGPGIAPEHLEKVFEPFWQAEKPLTRQAGGTGLGLSVSRDLAELLGGTLTVESAPGAGSTFTVRVPARIADETRC